MPTAANYSWTVFCSAQLFHQPSSPQRLNAFRFVTPKFLDVLGPIQSFFFFQIILRNP